jgi:hypothetical protein
MRYVLQSAVEAVRDLLEGPGGIRSQLEQMAATDPEHALLSSAFSIRSYGLKRGLVADEEFTTEPRIRIQVEKLVNRRSLKYAPFSGTCNMVLAIEANGDRHDIVAGQLNCITDAILLVLDNHVGELDDGIYFGGGYELQIGPVDRGGRGFQQTAQVRFELAMDDDGED